MSILPPLTWKYTKFSITTHVKYGNDFHAPFTLNLFVSKNFWKTQTVVDYSYLILMYGTYLFVLCILTSCPYMHLLQF